MSQVRSNVVCTISIAMTLLIGTNAHGQLTVPVPRPDPNGNARSYMQVEPVFTINGPRSSYTANAMRCHDYGPGPDKTTIKAGADLSVTWIMEASHPGDCYMYMSYDGANPVNFFKIASFLGCGATNGLNPPATVTQDIRIPAELPPCEHCVMRWEWTSHQQVVNIEFYVQCVDVKIVSTSGATKPTPMTAISGIQHLPAQASAYRQAYQGQNSPEHLVGPDVATYAACVAGTLGCIGTGTSPPSPNPGTPNPNPTPAPNPAPSPGRSFSGSFGGIKWRGGFETANVATEYSEIVGNPPAGRTVIITSGGGLQPRCGQKFLQVNIDGTDTAYNNNRVEIGFHPTTQVPEQMDGTTRYYGWSMAHDMTKPISSDSTYELAYWESNQVFAQTIGFYISDGQTLKLRTRGNNGPDTDVGSMAFQPGAWHGFVMGVKWSSQNDGWVRLWMDGQEVVPQTAHKTMHPGQPSFSHLGLFRIPRVNTEAIMYYDCVVYADSYDPSRAAGCYNDSSTMGTCSGPAPIPCPAPPPPPPCPAPSPGSTPSPYPTMAPPSPPSTTTSTRSNPSPHPNPSPSPSRTTTTTTSTLGSNPSPNPNPGSGTSTTTSGSSPSPNPNPSSGTSTTTSESSPSPNPNPSSGTSTTTSESSPSPSPNPMPGSTTLGPPATTANERGPIAVVSRAPESRNLQVWIVLGCGVLANAFL